MNTQKWGTLALYALMAAYMLAMPATQAAVVIRWIFIGLAVAHVLEFVMVYRLLAGASGSLLHHFVHTLLFGFMHWLPIRKAQQSQA